MFVCNIWYFSGILGKKSFDHLSSTWAQKMLPHPNVPVTGGGVARKKTGSISFEIRIFFQISAELCILLSQEHCSADQWVSRGGGHQVHLQLLEKKLYFS